MSSTFTTDEQRLPRPNGMERSDVLDLFIQVVNYCEPEHKYEQSYPIDRSDVEYSYTTSYYAKCGPRYNGSMYFAINMGWLQSRRIERLLAVITHEISHLKYGIGYGKPSHPADFWRAMAFYASELRDGWSTVKSWFSNDEIEKEKFLAAVVNDPNSSTVDRRIETVNERRQKMADLLGVGSEVVIK